MGVCAIRKVLLQCCGLGATNAANGRKEYNMDEMWRTWSWHNKHGDHGLETQETQQTFFAQQDPRHFV
jgi:hypothetical protein